MNKLRKLPPRTPQTPPGDAVVLRESRTTALARAAAATVSATISPGGAKAVKPLTPAEQYWAARALTAEALLSAQTRHREEVQAAESRRVVSATRPRTTRKTAKSAHRPRWTLCIGSMRRERGSSSL